MVKMALFRIGCPRRSEKNHNPDPDLACPSTPNFPSCQNEISAADLWLKKKFQHDYLQTLVHCFICSMDHTNLRLHTSLQHTGMAERKKSWIATFFPHLALIFWSINFLKISFSGSPRWRTLRLRHCFYHRERTELDREVREVPKIYVNLRPTWWYLWRIRAE